MRESSYRIPKLTFCWVEAVRHCAARTRLDTFCSSHPHPDILIAPVSRTPGQTNRNEANGRLRDLVRDRREYYLSSPNSQKAKIAHELIREWSDQGGRFLKRASKSDSKVWYEVSTAEAVRTVQVLLCRPRRDKGDQSSSNRAKFPVDEGDATAAAASLDLSDGPSSGDDEPAAEASNATMDRSPPLTDAEGAAEALIRLRSMKPPLPHPPPEKQASS
jgi:hypothetical protein